MTQGRVVGSAVNGRCSNYKSAKDVNNQTQLNCKSSETETHKKTK